MPSSLGIVNASNHDFTPADLDPVLWLDASDESTCSFSSSTGVYVDNGLVSRSSSSGPNHAGVFGSSRLVITDIDLVCKLKLANWNAANQPIIEHSTGAYRWKAYGIGFNNGTMIFETTDTGGTPRSCSVSIPSWSANSTRWVRARRVASTGNVSFFSSDDGIAWTQIGATQSLFSGAINGNAYGAFYIAQIFGNENTFTGTIYKIRVYDGDISTGTKVLDIDFEAERHVSSLIDTASRNTVSIISSTNGRAVQSVTAKGHSFPTAESFTQGTLAAMPALRADPKTGKLGLYFNGSQSMQSTQASSSWKFLHDGTQFLVAMAWSITETNPDNVRVPIGTVASWEANTVGWWVGYEDRSSNGSNNIVASYISNGSGLVCQVASQNNAFTTQETHILTTAFAPSAQSERGKIFVDGRQVAVEDENAGTPSSSDPFIPLRIGGQPGGIALTGIIHELIILSGEEANNQARLQLEQYLSNKYRTGLAGTADWLNGTYAQTATHHVVTFRNLGSFTPRRPLAVEYLIVGGGGRGASGDASGGGGAGGALTGSTTMQPRTYGIRIGAGSATVSSGEDSFVGDREFVAYGGSNGNTSITGGSGGGGNSGVPFGLGIPGQGNNGGTGGTPGPGGGGGGGGAGSVGQDGSNANQVAAGKGGDGIEWPSGSGIYYASGGGGAGSVGGTGSLITAIVPGGGGRGAGGSTAGESGIANTGGGGGSSRAGAAGSGGSGIVIIRWLKTA